MSAKNFTIAPIFLGQVGLGLVVKIVKIVKIHIFGIVIRCNGVWRANQELVRTHNDAAHEELVKISWKLL